MNKTPRGERLVISFFGNRNVGKSSLINALVEQTVAIVSDVPGTTTDPVKKMYELIPLGPVTLYDTPGLDDFGDIGEKRIESTVKVMKRTDLAIVVIGEKGITENDLKVIELIKKHHLPFLVVFNKNDIRKAADNDIDLCVKGNISFVLLSAQQKEGIEELKELIMQIGKSINFSEDTILGDLVNQGDVVVLVTPIDLSAPKGRLILPQVQVLRDLLDHNCIAVVVKETELAKAMKSVKPVLVVTDSQAIAQVIEILPPEQPFTTFSILFARYKGDIEILAAGANVIDDLQTGDKVLIAEACSHHTQSDDIGRFKIPQWINEYTGKKIEFVIYAGSDYPDDLSQYRLVIQCGGCMLNKREMHTRIELAGKQNVPITNYGVVISKVHNALDRTINPVLNRY